MQSQFIQISEMLEYKKEVVLTYVYVIKFNHGERELGRRNEGSNQTAYVLGSKTVKIVRRPKN